MDKKIKDKDKPAKKAVTKPEAPKKAAKVVAGKVTKAPAKPEAALPPSPQDVKAEMARKQGGSIAPPKENLVSAFSLLKKNAKHPVKSPAVTRLAASSLAKPPAPKPPTIVEKSHSAPAPATPPPTAAPVSKAPAQVPPKVERTPAAKAAVSPPAPKPAEAKPKPAPSVAKPSHETKVHKPAVVPAKTIPTPTKAAPSPTPSPVEAKAGTSSTAAPKILKKLEVSSMVTVRELGEKMEIKPNDLIKKLMGLGVFATINQRLDSDAAGIIAQEFGYELKVVSMYKEEELQGGGKESEKPESLKPRSPVVTVMGHVDHGKTSLLDAIRSARVAEGEAGGITQHIGAYKVKTHKGEIVFLDTPGHEAFTAMRARGAKVTDIVILVVSATDGVMPQTIEAIDHAKAADVPIVVAVNKIDLPGANPQKIRQELGQHGLAPEEWGGKTIFVDVSAKKKLNLDTLLDMVSIQAEVLEMKANPDRPGYGVILEAKLDPKKGSVATLLVQAGTVNIGDAFVAGLCYGKMKAMIDDAGNRINSAGPSTPVEILGLMGTPQAGDVFSVVSDDRQARDIAEKRKLLFREQTLAHQRHMTLVGLKAQGPAAKELGIVLKADAQGSLQALKDSLEGLSNNECRLRLIHAAIGNVNESDVLLAEASNAVVLVFHTGIDPRAQELATRSELEIRKYDIIYDLIADVKAALEGLLAPEIVDVVIGKGEVRQVFKVKGSAVAGCFILEGKVTRGAMAKVMRAGKAVYDGKVTSLKRFKDDVKEVEKNLDCGLCVDNFTAYQVGDEVQFLVKESRVRRLTPSTNV